MGMSKVLIVIDMQNDFIDGSLGTDDAKNIVKNVCNKIEGVQSDERILVTLDTHNDKYLNTFEGKKLPVEHCIKYTNGWLLNPDVRAILKNHTYKMFEKSCFADQNLIELVGDELRRQRWIESLMIIRPCENKAIEIVGLCTDICVISNALMLRSAFPDIPITVYADCCAGTTKEKHEAALEVMRSCQIDIAYMK